MKIDLHIHSTYSDGELTPRQILDECYKNDISVLSITDHDNVFGCKEAIKINPYSSLKIVNGIELNVKYNGGQFHLLGYNFDLDNKDLNEICMQIMDDNKRRSMWLIENLQIVYGFSFKDEDIEDIFKGAGNIGRPDIARLCIKYGYCQSVKEAFVKYFKPLEEKTIKRSVDLSDKEALSLILNAGGIASIAHPCTLNKDYDELKAYLKVLKNYGLEAIEIYHSIINDHMREEYLKIANELELLYSAGSDFHGSNVKPNIKIGSGINNNLNIYNASILSRLLEG